MTFRVYTQEERDKKAAAKAKLEACPKLHYNSPYSHVQQYMDAYEEYMNSDKRKGEVPVVVVTKVHNG